MIDLLFYVFSAVTLIAAVLMVLMPNAVNSAFCMIVAFLGTAALFVLLEAYFLAIIQVVVYAGAVMVLFLFIIMLLDVEKEQGAEFKHKLTVGASAIGFLLFVVLLCTTFTGGHLPEPALNAVTENPEVFNGGVPFTTSSKSFGYSLFTKYMLPFQVAGFLLLAAMIGVIVVSKGNKREESRETK